MNTSLRSLAVAVAAVSATGLATAQQNVLKVGIADYTTHSKSNGVTGIGVPAGADARTGDAVTVLFEIERYLTPNWGIELALGLPPRIKAKATGSVAFLGDDILSAKNVTPTLFVNYHFGSEGDRWRPYVGVGINYTRFVGIQSRLASDVRMSDSVGPAGKIGLEYVLSRQWSLFTSVSALQVKTDVVASGSTVLQTTIDLRPVVYSFGAAYRF